MIPLRFLRKLSGYEVQFGSVTVKVDVIDHLSFFNEKFSEFKKSAEGSSAVGLGFEGLCCKHYEWFLLCAGDRCLMVNLCVMRPIPESLRLYLTSKTTCFVALYLPHVMCKDEIGYYRNYFVSLGYLVSRVRKNPSFLSCELLEKLGAEVGLDIKPRAIMKEIFDWRAKVFSEEQVKHAIYNVYYSYVIGNKLLAPLE